MNNILRDSEGWSQGARESVASTSRHSISPRSASIRVRIRPHAPLPQQPLLIPCVEQTTLIAFKERITTLLNAKSDSSIDSAKIRLEIDGYVIADDCVVGDVVRETDVVEVHLEDGHSTKRPVQATKAKVHARSESSESSTSSSSASSSSEDSSSESSESDSSSNSNSDEHQNEGTATRTNGSANGWVPPGQGSIRTQRNNDKRRKRARAELNAEREKRLIETIKRVEKQALAEGGSVDKETEEESFAFDKEGYRAILSEFQNAIHSASNFDSTVTLPPGGGLLGLPTADLSTSSTMEQSSPTDKMRKARQHRRILPPSQRDEPVPACIRLTRVDCDECATPWPVEESAAPMDVEESDSPDGGDIAIANADALYLAFRAQGKEALNKMRADEEKKQKESASSKAAEEGAIWQPATMGLPATFGKPDGWNGNDILTSKSLAAAAAKAPLKEQQESSPTLDYGIPEQEKTESATETLDRLRKLRDQAKLQTTSSTIDLQAIRQAALRSIRKKLPS
ncbi:uncharacterized protein FA14DRAFT_157269 [Meira miltonrushii]|uniref:Uncharacterized protein n=1 Tax=Meira miltonrushii TaxID=1280837 RepID=A0A316V4V7_9BASI|nr:uncharacterized protein FA14DRAFT_157269 [Meira miltonrushii]PWN32560.1 hypothetical protein FA14DRAFT_157269 [Meira miltonrushii]